MSIKAYRPARAITILDLRPTIPETEIIQNPLVVNVISTTSSSTITLNITDDGTETGNPLFKELDKCYIDIRTQRPTTSNNEAPWAYIHSIPNNYQIVMAVKRSNTGGILLGGSYAGNADNNNAVTLRILIEGRGFSE